MDGDHTRAETALARGLGTAAEVSWDLDHRVRARLCKTVEAVDAAEHWRNSAETADRSGWGC